METILGLIGFTLLLIYIGKYSKKQDHAQKAAIKLNNENFLQPITDEQKQIFVNFYKENALLPVNKNVNKNLADSLYTIHGRIAAVNHVYKGHGIDQTERIQYGIILDDNTSYIHDWRWVSSDGKEMRISKGLETGAEITALFAKQENGFLYITFIA